MFMCIVNIYATHTHNDRNMCACGTLIRVHHTRICDGIVGDEEGKQKKNSNSTCTHGMRKRIRRSVVSTRRLSPVAYRVVEYHLFGECGGIPCPFHPISPFNNTRTHNIIANKYAQRSEDSSILLRERERAGRRRLRRRKLLFTLNIYIGKNKV